jgi:hypothetical protein
MAKTIPEYPKIAFFVNVSIIWLTIPNAGNIKI